MIVPNISPGDWEAVNRNFQKLRFQLGVNASPTFAGLTLSGLTASRLISTNASKALASTDLASWVSGTANEISVADDGDGTITIGIVDPLIVSKGGTGAATLTDGGILLGSGTGAVTALAQATHGQLPIGSTGADPVLATLTGTSNQVTVTNGAGTITLSLPQDIATSSSPTFASPIFTGTATGVTPTLDVHLATKGYVDLAIGTRIDFFLSNTAADVGSTYYMYPIETGEVQSTLNSSALGQGNNQLIFSFISEAGEPGINYLRDGLYAVHAHLNNGTGHKTTTIYATISYVDADGSSNTTLVATTETSGELTDSATGYDLHAFVGSSVTIDTTKRLLIKFYANVGATGTNSTVTITMEGTSDSHVAFVTSSEIYQRQGAVLDDLNTVGAVTGDDYMLVGTAAGVFAWETGATLRTSIGVDAAGTAAGLVSTHESTYNHANYNTAYTHSTVTTGNPHSVTKSDVGLGSVENTALSTWAGTASITTLGTIVSGVWNGTDIAIADGGTGQSTAQAAIDALTQVSAATNEHVLTKDTATGNAIWKAATGGSDAFTVKVDAGATAGYIGAAYNDGVLRVAQGMSYTDGGDYITIGGFTSRCSVYRSGAQSVNNATPTKVSLNAEIFDGDNEFDSATNYRFTAAVAGYYSVAGSVGLNAMSTGDYIEPAVYVNNSPISDLLVRVGGAGNIRFSVAHTIYLAVNDYVELFITHDHGSALNINTAAYVTYMGLHRLS